MVHRILTSLMFLLLLCSCGEDDELQKIADGAKQQKSVKEEEEKVNVNITIHIAPLPTSPEFVEKIKRDDDWEVEISTLYEDPEHPNTYR